MNDNMNSPETETPVVETPAPEAPVAEAVSAVEQAEAVVADAQPETPVAETSAPEPEAKAKGSEKPAPEPKPKNRNVWRLDGYARNKWIGTLDPATGEFDSGYHAMTLEECMAQFAGLMELKGLALEAGAATQWTAIRVACVAQQRIDE